MEKNQIIGGVCAGVAHYFDIDPTIVRVVWGVLAFCYGAGILAYIILWVVAPVSTDY
ncbi:PspC domain protein [Streptococcus oralis SK255]|uniref:PspC domain protein n=1 Tax=Streptococcus oralis SK255 TaxID=1005704 RepID=F5VVA8_STROR|nr:PspC domain protein [Streptococcus oralis SK255]